MPSPTCTVNGGSTANGVDVADDGGTVTIQLVDLSADSWAISITGSDDLVAVPTLSVNYTTKTATFTKPAGPWALIFTSKVNGGVDINGAAQPSYTTTFGVYVKTASQGLRLGAANERAEGSTAFGWTTKFNALTRSAEATSVVHDAAMHDANYAVAETAGTVSIGSDATFTADRTLTLKSAAAVGSVVEWVDEAVGTPSLNSHNLIVALDGAGNIQRKNANAATLTLGISDLGGGGSIQFRKMTATLWKALS